MKRKVDCYKCKWRREVPGSAHSACKHPLTEILWHNPMLRLTALLKGLPPVCVVPEGLGLEVEAYGIERGWFNFPFNFDPCWLIDCKGYEEVIT